MYDQRLAPATNANSPYIVAGDTGRQEFGNANASYDGDLLNIQLQGNRRDAAFATLEEGRAQALVQAMRARMARSDGVSGGYAMPGSFNGTRRGAGA